MLNYEVDPGLLRSLVPAGLTLDLWQGRAFVSLVGFQFVDLCVSGLRVPFHRRFDEVNLRFYVVRESQGERRRGVVFISEVVPRSAVAFAARLFYNEKYLARPMKSAVTMPAGASDSAGEVEYSWRHGGTWLKIGARFGGCHAPLVSGSEAHFIAEHYWGYGSDRRGRTLEYRVQHPSWSCWNVENSMAEGPFHSFYGAAFGDVIAGGATSAFVADGSPVEVFQAEIVAQ